MSSIYEKIVISTESESDRQYLVLKAAEAENFKIYNYQVQMISNNPMQGIIPFEVIRKNDDVMLYYDITGRESLDVFIKKNAVSKEQFINFLQAINENVMACGNLFLYENCLILDENMIYVDPKSGQLSMIYVPADIGENYQDKLRRLIITLITCTRIYDITPGNNFLGTLADYVTGGDFCVSTFHDMLRRARDTSIKDLLKMNERNVLDANERGNESRYDNASMNGNGSRYYNAGRQGNESKRNIGSRRGDLGKSADFSKFMGSDAEEDDILLDADDSDEEKCSGDVEHIEIGFDTLIGGYKLKNILFALALQMVVIFLAVSGETFLRGTKMDSASRYVLTALFVLVSDFLIYKLLFAGRRVSDTAEAQEKGVSRNNAVKDRLKKAGGKKGKHISKDVSENNYTHINEYIHSGEDVHAQKDIYEESYNNKVPDTFAQKQADRLKARITETEKRADRLKSQIAEAENQSGKAGTWYETEKNKQTEMPYSEQGKDEYSGYNETVLLSDYMGAHALLVSMKEGSSEKIKISKKHSVIGRNPEVCDIVISERAVGRVHAELTVKDGSYYLIDKNSKNGTMINENRLTGGVEYKIHNGDIITFANVQFRFETLFGQ